MPLLATRVLELCNQYKLIRGQRRNLGKALLGFVLQLRGGKTSNSFLCWLPAEEAAGSLCGKRAGVCPGVGVEGSLRWSAHPLGGTVYRVHASTLLLLLLVFLYLFIDNMPQLCRHTASFSPF